MECAPDRGIAHPRGTWSGSLTRANVFLLTLAVAACRSEPIPEWQRFPAGTPLVPRYVTVDGTRIRYVEAGHGPPVVLIHGLAASLYSWRHTMVPVAEAGYRVIAFDNRGFGFSDKPAHGY